MVSTRETLGRFYEAGNAYMRADAPDFAAVAPTLDPDCLLRQPASLPYGGEWRGHAGFERWVRAFRETWSALSVRDPQVFDTDDPGVVFSRSDVRATGRQANWPLLQQVEVRDGRIRVLQPFHWDTVAILAALQARRVASW